MVNLLQKCKKKTLRQSKAFFLARKVLSSFSQDFFVDKIMHMGFFSVVPFQTKLMSLIYYFWQLLVANCDYAESYGWFLSGGNADASHTVYLILDAS